jgi:tripartite-type tricarboxylate transporter receptor subunit TctC
MNYINKLAFMIGMVMLCGFGVAKVAMAEISCPGDAIRMVIPNPPGGPADIIARVLGEKVRSDLGQGIFIENRAGATTTIGTNYVARSKADGCTLLSLTASGVVASVLRNNLPYNLTSDFTPILSLGSFPMVLTVPAASSIKSFADLLAAAKSKDGLTYGSGGAGSLAHLSLVRLVREVNGNGTHVPYKGSSEAMQALLGNQIQVFFASTAEVLPFAKTGKVRLIAVTSDQRLPLLPDVPTTKELGLVDFNPRLWYAYLAPSSTPKDIIAQLHGTLVKAATDSSVQERLSALGFAPEIKDGQVLSAYMKAEAVRWGAVIKENNIANAD